MRLVLVLFAACSSVAEPPVDPNDPNDPSDPSDPVDPGDPAAPCTVTGDAIACEYQTLVLDGRDIHYALPLGEAPAGGWPVVIYYQGSFVSAEQVFAAEVGATFGAYHASHTVANLLAAGFAVLAPEALGGGSTAWETNLPPISLLWDGSADDRLVRAMFDAIDGGAFGSLDGGRLHAMGISSGGYMTSRMAVSYPGRFRALAIHSASYATCSTLCVLPSTLPADHPPTLFLIGANDLAVPLDTVDAYHDQLVAEGRTADAIVDPVAGHAWIPAATAAIRDWFLAP